MASIQDKIEKELTCSICMDLFEDPVTFPCLHSFCRHCIQYLLYTADEALVCPNCRKRTGLRPGGSITDLPKNATIANLVNLHKKSKQSVSGQAAGTSSGRLSFNNATATCLMTSQNNIPVGGVPHHVTCCACGSEVFGVRFRCCECVNFDLCSRCEAAGHHDGHDMIKVVSPKSDFPRLVFSNQSVFRSLSYTCDVCKKGISGIRYNCYVCNDFDLCKSCEQKNCHPGHDMRRVVKDKILINNVPTEEEAIIMVQHGTVHPYIRCDVCDSTVRGVRYKCVVCADYDLCAICLLNGNHLDHDMRKIDPPD